MEEMLSDSRGTELRTEIVEIVAERYTKGTHK